MAVISYKCPNCDGELVFDPASQQYKCPYCISMFSQEELDKMSRAESTEQVDESKQEMDGVKDGLEGTGWGPETESGETSADEETGAKKSDSKTSGEAASKEESKEEALIYTCPSCGAEIVTDATTAATFCYYCHNPVVLGGRLEGKFLPNRIIPFQLDKKKAETSFIDYVSHKKFVPKAFFDKKNIEKLSGVYFPYWLYSVDLNGHVTAEAKRIRTWRVGDEEYTETKMYELTREGNVQLDNLPENALKKANSKLAEGVLPYRFEEMKEFHMGYLSGFLAEKRDIDSKELEAAAQKQMRDGAEFMMKSTMKDYAFVSVRDSGFRARSEDWKYVLLPVWTVTYKGNDGKIYYYSMNGQTGKICGELPIDKKKLALSALGVFAAVCTFLLIGGFLL